MSLLSYLAVWWQSLKARRKMDRVFGRRADPFKYSNDPYELKRLAAMEQALGKGKFKRALEVGCAEGHFSQRLVRRCEAVVCLDISEIALSRAKKAAPQAEFVRADIRSYEPSGQFDLIVLGDVLYYLDKPGVRAEFERTFDRVKSWLAPGGTLLLAHAFATPGEREHRGHFTSRFVEKGLTLVEQSVIEPDDKSNPVRCLLAKLTN